MKKIEQLIAEYNLDITTYKYRSKNETFHQLQLSHKRLRIVLRKKLQTSFLEECTADWGECQIPSPFYYWKRGKIALEPLDLENTVKGIFSTIYDIFCDYLIFKTILKLKKWQKLF